jgi:hypothetical protein
MLESLDVPMAFVATTLMNSYAPHYRLNGAEIKTDF